MGNISRIFESKNIEELHRVLKNNSLKPLSDNSYLEQVPNLIKSLYEKELSSQPDGLKQLKIKKQAAESIFYCYKIAVGSPDPKLNNQNSADLGFESHYEALRQKYNTALSEYLRNGTPLSDDALRANKYCLVFAKVLNLDLPQMEPSTIDFLPPLSTGLKEKIEYNKAAVILNGKWKKDFYKIM